MPRPSAPRDKYPYQNEPDWSRSEKAIAHRVFDAALKRELQEVMLEAKRMANLIREPDDLWKLERYLSQRRKDIDGKYDFRSSRLAHVLGRLMSEGRVTGEELRGLREDKLKAIRSCAEVISEDVA